MKIGVNLLLWTTHLGRAHLPVLQMLKRLGCDGVEVPVFAGQPADFAEIGRMVAGEGLAAGVVATMAPGADPLSADKAKQQAGAARLRWLIDCAQALQAEVVCGPFHQPLAQFSGAGITPDEWGRMVESQRAVADYAAGLRLAIEPLNRFECYALNSAADAARLVAEVGRPNYGYLYDTFHANIEEKHPWPHWNRRCMPSAISMSRKMTAARRGGVTRRLCRHLKRSKPRAMTIGCRSRRLALPCLILPQPLKSGGGCLTPKSNLSQKPSV